MDNKWREDFERMKKARVHRCGTPHPLLQPCSDNTNRHHVNSIAVLNGGSRKGSFSPAVLHTNGSHTLAAWHCVVHTTITPGQLLLDGALFLWFAYHMLCVCRGLRHYWGLKVKGQHTKTTGRRGARMAMLAKQAGK